MAIGKTIEENKQQLAKILQKIGCLSKETNLPLTDEEALRAANEMASSPNLGRLVDKMKPLYEESVQLMKELRELEGNKDH